MTKTSWRNWFSRCVRRVFFSLRGFFVGAQNHSVVRFGRRIWALFQQSFRMISTQKRSKMVWMSTAAFVIFLSATMTVFALRAKAEKEVHAYISPSYVTGEGFERVEAALVQDFSVDARFSDFTPEYVARVAFGSFAQTVEESVQEELLSSTTTPSATTTESTSGAPADTGVVPAETTSVSESSTVPASEESSSAPSLENPIETNGAQSAPEAPSTEPLSFLRSIVSPKTILAQETPESAPVSVAEDTPESTLVVEGVEAVTAPVQDDNTFSVDATSSATIVSDTVKEEKENRDPYAIASCSVFSKPCHMAVFEGFGVGTELSQYPVRNAEVVFSVAAKSLPTEQHDRLLVRAYKNGRWVFLGEHVVRGETDNAFRGGYLRFPLELSSWSDLSDMIVVAEYVREGESDSTLLLDAAWVDVGFEAAESPDDLALFSPNVKSALLSRDAERRAKERDTLDVGAGAVVHFENTISDLPSAKLRVATTKEKHAVLGTGEEYVAVTNFSNATEQVRLSFFFPDGNGRVTSLSKYVHNAPVKNVETEVTPIAYVCESPWVIASSSLDVSSNEDVGISEYTCLQTEEKRSCASLSDDATNCYSEVTTMTDANATVFRRGFYVDAITGGPFSDEQSIFGKALSALLLDMPEGIIPSSSAEVSHSQTYDIEPGATKYFKFAYNVPLNARSDVYIQAVSSGGAYGLSKIVADGSWNWRVPVDVGLPYATFGEEAVVPISLDRMPQEFWTTVHEDGLDIRVSDERGVVELPSWVSEFNFAQRKGLVWVRLPHGSGVMPRVYLYAGNSEAASKMAPEKPFLSSSLIERAVVMSEDEEVSSVKITALADDTRVRVGDAAEKNLVYGETVLYEHVPHGALVYANGPVAVHALSLSSRAIALPFGVAGNEFGIAEKYGEFYVASTRPEESALSLDQNEEVLVPYGLTHFSEHESSAFSVRLPSVAALFDEQEILPLLSRTSDERLRFSASALLDQKADAVRAVCPNGYAYGVFDVSGASLATTTCGNILNGPFEHGMLLRVLPTVGKTSPGALFSYVLRGNEYPMLQSAALSRGTAGFDPEVAFGAPEFVVPGEHRIFDIEGEKERAHVSRFLSKQREFAAEENPTFRFQYVPQSGGFFRTLRSLVGAAPFAITNVSVEQAGAVLPITPVVSYGSSLEWTVTIDKKEATKIVPGKLLLRMTIKEGGQTYEDVYDFYWGLLAVNFNKATYEQGEIADIWLGALSETGNTVCDAKLKIFITDTASSTVEVPVVQSGKCDGNSVVDVPDYSASYPVVDVGVHSVRVLRLDEQDNVIAEVRSHFNAVSRSPFVIERKGPTRINPTAPYSMTLRVFAREAYEGQIVEQIPADFEVLERGGSTLRWKDDSQQIKEAVWSVKMKAGEIYQFTYTFDAADKSPYIYFLGPARIGDTDSLYIEPREWQIASDVAGNMLIYWDGGTTPPGWTCVSCLGTDPFYQRYPMGSSTPSINGGATTHTHTFTTSVSSAIYSTSILVNTGIPATLVYKDHTHAFTPTFATGSNLPPSMSLRILRANAVGDVPIPQNAIVMFESTPPSGWTTYSTLDGNFPYGDSGIFNTQGSATHSHALSGTLGTYSGGSLYRSTTFGIYPKVANTTHGHAVTATSTNTISNDPPYVTYMLGKASAAGALPNGAITMWDNDPASGWVHLSVDGAVMSNRFVKAMSSAGATGGLSHHEHTDTTNIPTGASNSNTSSASLSGSFGSNPNHTHTVDYTLFSDAVTLPPYRTVVFAKRSVGVPEFTQTAFRFYDNVNDPLPVDPWPAGAVDVAEGMSIEDVAYRIKPGSTFRLRVSAQISNATATASTTPLKLQYSTDGACSTALNWNDVGTPGGSAPLRGYDNTLVSQGTQLASVVLASSTLSSVQFYSESSSAQAFTQDAGIGTYAEFDWVLQAGTSLASSSRYCLRMVEGSGKVFGQYSAFPSFLSNSAPIAPVLQTQFNHAKILTLTPTLTFAASDEEGNPMHYAIEIDDDPNFGSPVVSHSTTNNSAYFSNLTTLSNKAPYNNADTIQYTVQNGALANNTTYWWRVRAMDPTGSTQYGLWSSARAFTTDTSLATSAWFQTTDAQFVQNTLENITISGNAARLTGGQTSGTMYSPSIVFNAGPMGTVWGSLLFTDDGGAGITYQVEYQDEQQNWVLIPDTALSGNSTGFGSSPVSLTSVDPQFYPAIRLRANFTNSGTPVLSDWGVNWAYKTLAPILSSPFNHAKVSTTTPALLFASTDPLNRPVTYEVQYSTDPTFTTSTTCNSDSSCTAGFKNIDTPADTSPFTSAERVEFTFQTPLTNGTTYFYRVRGYGFGSGAWSFWSEVRAFTVDTAATTYPTWFQTMKGQWDADTLSGTYANPSHSVAVATTSDRVLVVYGDGSNSRPKYRFYENGVLGTAKEMLSINSTVLWAVARPSLVNDQFVVGTMGADRDVRFQVFENGIWSRLFTLTDTSPSDKRRSFDVAYESQSGRAVAVACSGTDAVYAIFDGSTWGSVQNLDLPFTTNCELVKMASSPTQNQIIALFRNTGSTFRAEVWNGTQWDNGSAMSFSASAQIQEPAHDGMAIEYERTSGKAVAVVSNNTTRGFRYRVWSGNNWGTETAYALLGGNDGNRTNAQFEWGNLRRSPTSNDLMLCGISQYSPTDDGAYTEFVRWNAVTPAWEPTTASKLGEYWPYSRHAQSNDCVYETKSGRANKLVYVADESWQVADGSASYNRTIFDVLSNTTNMASAWQSGASYTTRIWSTYAAYRWYAGETWTSRLERASYSGDILGISLMRNSLSYIFRMWNGSAWSSAITMGASSVTTKPYGQPYDMSAQQGLTQGKVFSSPIVFADGNGPSWRQARFTTTRPVGTTALISVEYESSPGNWERVPDAVIPGNSTGTSTSPIDLSGLNSSVYSVIRLRADLTCNGFATCPTLDDWTVEWAAGLNISGIARDNDRTTALTSGTVKVAVNGVEQVGKTGAISGTGTWTISGVNYKNGETVTVWIDNPGVANRAVSVVKYAGAGNLSNVELSRRWLTIGDSGQAGQTITNADLKLFDNYNESLAQTRADIFFNVDGSDNLTACASAPCSDASIVVATGTTWRPKASGTSVSTLSSLVLNGEVTADANTIKIGGDWRNTGTFTPGTSVVIFTATSSTRILNNTGAAQYKFYSVTFGEGSSSATWQLQSPLYTNGDLVVNYGTLSPLSQPISIEKSLSLGSNGVFLKGTATTTFLGTAVATWSDLTALQQDMGNVLVDGSPKTLTLSTPAKATSLTIADGDTFAFGVNTLTLSSHFTNNGYINSGSGRLSIAASGTANVKQGGQTLNNVTLASGTVTWIDAHATTTGDLLISGGAVNLPAQSLAVGGSFLHTAGSFAAPLTTRMTSNVSGKQLSLLSSLQTLEFVGTGAWSFISSATTTGTTSIQSGSVTLPSGILAVGGNLVVSPTATLQSNTGTVRMYGASATIQLNGKQLSSLVVASGSSAALQDATATFLGSLTVDASGVFTPASSSTLTIGGSLINNGSFIANASHVIMNRAAGPATLSIGSSMLSKLTISGAGSFSIIGNTRVTSDFALGNVGAFSMESGRELRVDGFYTTTAQQANTTWTGSTLRLTSGATMSANTKTTGGDSYGSIILDENTQLRLWNSDAVSITTNAGSSVYAQNWANVSGALRIYGTYTQQSGTAWWSYATDFDGTALPSGSERTATVAIAPGSSVAFATSSALAVIGDAGASTTVATIGVGNYAMSFASSTLSAQFATFSGMNTSGLSLSGATNIAVLSDVSFTTDINAGNIMTFTADVVNANAGEQYYRVGFDRSSLSATNIRVLSATTQSLRFKQHYGNIDGESFDNDPTGNPGEIRWDDSNYLITISGTVYSDAGVTPMDASVCDGATPAVTIKVSGGGSFTGPCDVGGTFSIPNVSFTGETTMSIFLDDTGAQAVTVTRGASVDLSGIRLYQNRVILRHEDVTPMTIAALSDFDVDDDSDMIFTANGGTLSVPGTAELWVWSGKTFTPGGNVTTAAGGTIGYGGAFHLDNSATYTASSGEIITIGGRFQMDSSAILNAASSTFVFNPSDTRTLTATAPIVFHNLEKTGVGTLTVSSTMAIGGTFTITMGTLSGVGSITAQQGIVGDGTVSLTGGTVTLPNGGFFGGNTAWTVNNLVLGDTGTSTTIKTGAGTTTVRALLTVRSQHSLDLNATPLVFTGSNTVLSVLGSIDTTGATITYAPTGTVSVANIPYTNLSFMGTGTSTLPAMQLQVAGNMTIGGGASTPKVTALVNDPTITVGGNISIASGARFTASDVGTLFVSGSWTNAGVFTHSLGSVQFTGGGVKTVNPGSSPFGNISFADDLGSWTILENATATNMVIASTSAFTMASGRTLEITGSFSNAVGGTATTWTGATLFVNSGTRSEINTKTAGADTYDIVRVGANTQTVFWNSSSTQFVAQPTGGALSLNHAGIAGDAYVFGDYTRSTGTEYWSYYKDFDGAVLNAGDLRAPRIRFAPSSTASFVGTSAIELVGVASATTTVEALSGSYGLNFGGATSTLQFVDFSGMNATGIQFTGSGKVTQFDDIVLRNPSGVGTMVSLAASVITANPLRTTYRNAFIAPGGTNISVTGTTTSAWRIRNHYGGRDGEAFDGDPAGDPGYVIWDDSAAQIYISGKVLQSDGVTVSSACNGVSQYVALKVQGSGTLTSACSAVDGSYSIGPIVYAPYDTLAVYTTAASGVQAVSYAYRPMTNIGDYDLYERTIILRNEQDAITNAGINSYDKDNDANIPVRVTGSALVTDTNSKVIVWDGKKYQPQGSVTVGSNMNASSIDGDVELRTQASWITGAGEQYTIGGDLVVLSQGQVLGMSGEFIFTSAVAGKSVSALSSTTLPSLRFNGTGSWSLSGFASTTGTLLVSQGTVALPASTFGIGGSFTNQGTVQSNNGTLFFEATTTGNQIRTNGSTFGTLLFTGVGSWEFMDSATTTGAFTVASGTVKLPAGSLSVGLDFENTGGSFIANGGTVIVRGAGTRKVAPGGSAFHTLRVENGDYVLGVQHATSTGDVTVASGSLELPTERFAVGGSFRNSGTFIAGASSTVIMNATSTGKIINPGTSSFTHVIVQGPGGGFTLESSATSTGAFEIKTANAFVVSPSVRLVVREQFLNAVGGTWTGSTLRLEKVGTSTINLKTDPGAAYNTVELGPGAQVRSWKSSYGTVNFASSSAIYSQNDNNVNGALRIYGEYRNTATTDHWSATTDFDGSAVASRAASVRFASGSSAYYGTGSGLKIVGSPAATTTVQSLSGTYGLTFENATFEARYLRLRNTDVSGVAFLGDTAITALDYADLATGVDTGRILTFDASAVNRNTGSLYTGLSFAYDSGHTSGVNAYLNGTTSNAITFTLHSGAIAGEAFDNDQSPSACGAFRWDDSSCQFIDQRYYRWRNNDGGEAVPDSSWYNGSSSSWTHRQKVHVVNTGTIAASSVAIKVVLPYQAQMQADFRDIRFTQADGITLIPHWIEKYSSAGTAHVWVKIPSLPSSGTADVYVYYGNTSAAQASSGTSTFAYFYDAESGLTGMSGDTSMFTTGAARALASPFSSLGSNMLKASVGNENNYTNTGMANTGAGVSSNSTIRGRMYVDVNGQNDDFCTTFAVAGSISANYGYCLSPLGVDERVRIVRNATRGGRDQTTLAEESPTFNTSGWYDYKINWASGGNITATLYDPSGTVISTLSTTDSTHTTSGIGFTFWYQHEGWDDVRATALLASDPTVIVFPPQQHGGATWLASENVAYMTANQGDILRLRAGIRNTGTALSNQQLRLDYAAKGAYANCESVPDGHYGAVPTQASCTGSPVCMATSTHYANDANTTPLLSTPKGLAYTAGRMVEDPSNYTTAYNIPMNTYTEVEYAMTFTSSAMQPSYCFRVSNNGDRLVSYTKVAEAAVLQAPIISNFDWNASPISLVNTGTTTRIFATGTVTDYNGVTDLASSTGVVYRSLVSGGHTCTANDNNCYREEKVQCSLSDCAGFSCTISCSVDLQYFADPTDVGDYASEDWRFRVSVFDSQGLSDTDTAVAELNSLKAIALGSAVIDYGSIEVGSSTPSGSNPSIAVQNAGNTLYEVQVAGTNLSAAGSAITVDNQRYATSTFAVDSCTLCGVLSPTPTGFGLILPKPVSTVPVSENLYWGIQIPNGTKTVPHNGTISLLAS